MPRALKLILGGLCCLLIVSLSGTWNIQVGAAAQAPGVAAQMKQHYDQMIDIHEAVMRGDLEAVQASSKSLAESPGLPGLKGAAATEETALKAAAKQVAAAADLKTAAGGVATMASTCGACHQASKATPKLPEPTIPKGEGAAGHMLEHQVAAEYLYQGLIAPSDALWMKGAQQLKQSPLAKTDMPDDPQLTQKIMGFEGRVHTIADRGQRAKDTKTRVALYGELINGCAECHSLHGRVWGPGVPKP